MLLYVQRSHIRLIKEREHGSECGGWGRGRRLPMNSSSLRSGSKNRKDRQPPPEQTPPVRSNLYTPQTFPVTKTSPKDQLLRNNSAARQSIQLCESSSTSLLLISPGLCQHAARQSVQLREPSSTSLLLISPGLFL